MISPFCKNSNQIKKKKWVQNVEDGLDITATTWVAKGIAECNRLHLQNWPRFNALPIKGACRLLSPILNMKTSYIYNSGWFFWCVLFFLGGGGGGFMYVLKCFDLWKFANNCFEKDDSSYWDFNDSIENLLQVWTNGVSVYQSYVATHVCCSLKGRWPRFQARAPPISFLTIQGSGLEIRLKKGTAKMSKMAKNGYGSMLFHRTFLRGTIAIGKGMIAIGYGCRRLFRALKVEQQQTHPFHLDWHQYAHILCNLSLESVVKPPTVKLLTVKTSLSGGFYW